MKRVFVLFIISASFFVSRIQSEQVSDMREIQCILETTDSSSLVIFDIDMVLVQPAHPAFQMLNMKKYSPICKKVMKDIPQDKRMIFLCLMTCAYDSVLIHSCIPEIVSGLKNRRIPTMALTNNLTGTLGDFVNLEQTRINTLRRLGIDFSKTAPHSLSLDFEDLPLYRGYPTKFMEGVLFVNGTVTSKGEALLAFLRKISFYPTKIIFIDDREDNLRSVEDAVNNLDKPIVFKGIHFTGAQAYPSDFISEEEFKNYWQLLAAKTKELL